MYNACMNFHKPQCISLSPVNSNYCIVSRVVTNFVFIIMKISVIIRFLLVTVVASTPLKFDHLGESIKLLSYPPSLSIPIPPQLLFLVRTCLKSSLMNISLFSSLLIALAANKVPNGCARDDAYSYL